MNTTKEIIISVFSVAIKVVILVIAAMFIYKYALVAYDYGFRIFSEEPMSSGEGRTVEVTVNSEMDAKDIGELLENRGLIRDSVLFVLQERVSEEHGKIKPGKYELSTAMTTEQMLKVMAADNSEEEAVEESQNYIESENSMTEEMVPEMTGEEGLEVEESTPEELLGGSEE